MQTTFIIVSYNTKDLTLACLKSIYKFEKNCEVIVVDNNSQDNTVSAIRQKFPSAKIITSDQNLGFAKANNLAIFQSTGDYIILINSDTELIMPISHQLTSHFIDPRIGASVPKLLNPDRSIQASVFHLPSVIGAVKEFWLKQPFVFTKYAPPDTNHIQVEAAVMACMCIPKTVLEQIGNLDDRYFMYYEDLEFCRRLKKTGYQIFYDPNIKIIHHHGASGKLLDSQGWRRLIPSSKMYHGLFVHYLITFILWSGQKLHKR